MFKEQRMNKMGFLNNRVVIMAVLLYVAFMCVVEFRKELFQTSKGLDLSQDRPLFRPTCAVPRYSAVSLPVTGLVSFPGSGNNWMRHLVQEASGILTGSEYNDTELLQNGFPAEGVTNGSTILVKTHGSDEETMARYAKAVLLVRHPKDAILAEFNRYFGGGHLSLASEQHFRKDWKPFSYMHGKVWYSFHKKWLLYSRPMLVVHYSDLEAKLTSELERVWKFLQISVTTDRLKCAINTGQKFKRQRPRVLYRQPLYDHRQSRYLNRMYEIILGNIKEKFKDV